MSLLSPCVAVLFLIGAFGVPEAVPAEGEAAGQEIAPQGDAAPAPSKEAPGGSSDQQGAQRVVIPTTHVVNLVNGKAIRCNFVEGTEGIVRLVLGPYGSFEIPRERVSEIRPERGEIVVLEGPQRPTSREGVREEKRAEVEVEVEAADAIAPPPVSEERKKEIDYWLYHLTRQRQHWRVRAERYLKAMGPVVTGPVIPYAKRPEWLIRCAALRILAAVRHPAGVPVLLKAMEDPEPNVRQVAHEGLHKLTGQRLAFDPRGSRADRMNQLRRWELYLREKGLLPR